METLNSSYLPPTDQVAVDRHRLGGIVERVMLPARELRRVDGYAKLIGVAVAARRIFASLREAASDIHQGIGTIPIPDEAAGVHVPQHARLNRHRHVGDNGRVLFFAEIELREVSEESAVGVVGLLDALHLRENVLPGPRVGNFGVGQTPDEARRLFAILVVDERGDGKRLAP